MKNSYLLIVVIVLFSNCSSEKSLELSSANLIGSWELFQVKLDIGDGNSTYQTPDDPFSISFTKDREFISDMIADCNLGNYSLENAILKLKYDCEENKETVDYRVKFEGKYLVLTNVLCIEACDYKFKRLAF